VSKIKHIVFICTGNICRSPMAEAILRQRCQEQGHSDLVVSSMGIHGLTDSPAFDLAQEVCEENGVDMSSHSARAVLGEELQEADLILCMETVHSKFLQTFFPWHRSKIFLLGAWPKEKARKSAIKDPMGGSIEDFRRTFNIIQDHIDRILPLLLER
jgi:protein-tyrosine phosphatase